MKISTVIALVCGMVKKRKFLAISVAVAVCVVFLLVFGFSAKVVAGNERYDKLIVSASEWSARHSINEADKARQAGDMGKALVLYMAAEEKMAEDDSNFAKELGVRSCLSRGDIYFEGGNYSEALKAYLKGLQISETSDHEPQIALLYKKIASVYSLFRDYGRKNSLETKGYEKACQHRDTAMMASLLNSLARGNVARGNPKAARKYYDKLVALNYGKTSEERYQNDYTHAMVVRCEGNVEGALRLFQNLVQRYGVIKDPRYICSVYNEMFWIYNEKPLRSDSAEYYLRECLRLVKENHLELLFLDEFKELSALYQRLGRNAEATKCKNEYYALMDSLYVHNSRKVDNVSNQQFLYEMDKAGKEISRLWDEKRRSGRVITFQRWVIIGIFAAIVAAALLIWYIVRQKRRLSESYRSLYSLNKSLADKHREAMDLQRGLEDEIESLKEKLDVLPEASGQAGDESPAMSQAPQAEEKEKYRSSGLGAEQIRLLARRIMDFMENNTAVYCNPDFSLGVLAEHVNSNNRYVSQVINHTFKKGFNGYVNEYRVREACERLAGKEIYGTYSVKGIGESVGFKSHTTFVGVFKKITGMTPSEYRKMAVS